MALELLNSLGSSLSAIPVEVPLQIHTSARIDWSVEKTKLLFEEPVAEKRRRTLQRLQEKSWRQLGRTSANEAANEDQIHLVYDREEIGCIFLERDSSTLWRLSIAIDDAHFASDFIKNSLLRVGILAAQIKAQEKKIVVEFHADAVMSEGENIISNLVALGFRTDGNRFVHETDGSAAEGLRKLKKYLLEYVKAAPYEGRGYLLDVRRLSQDALGLLNDEYHEVAWGVTNWARHSSIGADEIEIISRYATGESGVEIGAGSGRVTFHLQGRFKKLTATDVIPSALRHVELGWSPTSETQLTLKVDDIRACTLPVESYDVVMFWENGLGAILVKEERELAIKNMVSLLRPGGRLILGVRNLVSIPVDQLMVAAQTNLVMGVYHTFTQDEVIAMMPNSVKLIACHKGLPRPAGGHQLFLVFERSHG